MQVTSMVLGTLSGMKVYYELNGEGAPLVLIAGYACDHAYWGGVLPGLQEHFQVLSFDNRAVGQTHDENCQSFNLEQLANDAINLIQQLGVMKPSIVGHSMGGGIAQIIARKYPEKINKLILLNSSATIQPNILEVLERHLMLRKNNILINDILDESLPWFFSKEFLADSATVARLRQLIINNPYFQSIADQERQLNALRSFNSSAWLHEINAPTLVIASKEDRISSLQQGRELADAIKDATFTTLPGGHSSPIEQPQKLIEEILEFERF